MFNYSVIPSFLCVVFEFDWLLNVTCNDISVIYVTAHRCAGGMKKFDLRRAPNAIDIS